MPVNIVDSRFAFITHEDGTRFQILLLDPETGDPIDWDEQATALLIEDHSNTGE
jgi:hypothetical protein